MGGIMLVINNGSIEDTSKSDKYIKFSYFSLLCQLPLPHTQVFSSLLKKQLSHCLEYKKYIE